MNLNINQSGMATWSVKEIKEMLKSNTFNVYMMYPPTPKERATPYLHKSYRVVDAKTRAGAAQIQYIDGDRFRWCPISATLSIYQN